MRRLRRVSPREPGIVVIGGANVDVKAQSDRPAIEHTSNPGRATTSSGGVARNIAENLARLGDQVHLISVVGRDPLGDELLDYTGASGVDVGCVVRTNRPTGTYTAVLDSDGELLVAIADMSAVEELDPPALRARADLIRQAGLIVADGNLRRDSLEELLDLADGVRVIVEPVSVPKVSRWREVIDERVFALTPGREELAALSGMPTQTDDELVAASRVLHDKGVQAVWVSLGDQGSLLSTIRDTEWFPAIPGMVTDVTGAGDAMLAAFCHVLLEEGTLAEAVRLGHAAAAVTVGSPHTVHPDLTLDLLESTVAIHSDSHHEEIP